MEIKYKERKGPKPVPVIGNLHQLEIKNMHNQLEDWASEYGYVYRVKLGPKKFTVVTEPSMIQEILKNRPEGFRRMKKMDEIFSEFKIKGVFNVEGEEWKKHRKLIAKGLDVKHQIKYFPALLNSMDRLLYKWNRIADKKEIYNIQDDFLRFTVDVTTALAFGHDINTLEEEGGVIQNDLEKIFPMLFKRINSPFPIWRYIKSKKDKEFDKAWGQVNKFVDDILDKGRDKLSANPDLKENPSNILEALLAASKDDDGISDYEVKGNLLTILMAGEDTTAHTLAWSIYYLCLYPEVQKQIREEVVNVMRDTNKVEDYSKLNDFPYLDALIMETMRLKPVAPLLLLEANESILVGEHRFEKQEQIIVESRFACKHAEHFLNASEFSLERWIENGSVKAIEGHNLSAYMPFGAGTRFCPGKNLAMLELRLVISALVKNFSISLKTPASDIKEIKAFTMMPSKFFIEMEKL